MALRGLRHELYQNDVCFLSPTEAGSEDDKPRRPKSAKLQAIEEKVRAMEVRERRIEDGEDVESDCEYKRTSLRKK